MFGWWRSTGWGNPAGRVDTSPPALYSPWREPGVHDFFSFVQSTCFVSNCNCSAWIYHCPLSRSGSKLEGGTLLPNHLTLLARLTPRRTFPHLENGQAYILQPATPSPALSSLPPSSIQGSAFH